MAAKKRRASSRGFSEDDLEAILATLPASPNLLPGQENLFPPQEIRQWLQHWHSKYSDLARIKLNNMEKDACLAEARSALFSIEIALLKANNKFLELQIENIIDQSRIHLMDSIIENALAPMLGAFSKTDLTRSEHFNKVIDFIRRLEEIFERPREFSSKRTNKKVMEREAIYSLAMMYWHSTWRKPTVTNDPVSGERRGPYLEFATAVISRVWEGQRPTRLIVEMGREVGTEIDAFLSE